MLMITSDNFLGNNHLPIVFPLSSLCYVNDYFWHLREC